MTNFHDPTFETDTPSQVAQSCVYNFCKHPEHHGRLRAEALKYKDVSFGSSNSEMPYLDSFVKETARLNPGPIRKPATLSRDSRARRGMV